MRVAKDTSGSTLDRFGAACSTLCAVHCALTAALPSALAALGLGAMSGPGFEWGFTLLAIAFAGAALVLGYKRHRNRWIAAALVAGIAGLLASRFLEEAGVEGAGPVLAVVAGVLLAGGHIAGLRSARRERQG